ncbi:MAG: helix-turn-helix transcriptional regulator [Cyanobacteria bacterium P01_A01_bin.83]
MNQENITTKEGIDTLKSYIESAGYTQTSLAKEMNLSTSIIGYWVAGTKKPRVDRFFELCEKLNVSAKKLGKSIGLDVSNIPDD